MVPSTSQVCEFITNFFLTVESFRSHERNYLIESLIDLGFKDCL